MKGQMDTQYGQILIDTDVIATYAGSVAVECFGIVGMAAVNMKDGLVKLLKRDYLNHGINVKVDENNEITIDFHVIVAVSYTHLRAHETGRNLVCRLLLEKKKKKKKITMYISCRKKKNNRTR